MLVSKRNGKELTFDAGEKDPDIQACLGVLRHLMTRQFEPCHPITIETINGKDAAKSPYVDVLRVSFEVMMDYKNVVLYRTMK